MRPIERRMSLDADRSYLRLSFLAQKATPMMAQTHTISIAFSAAIQRNMTKTNIKPPLFSEQPSESSEKYSVIPYTCQEISESSLAAPTIPIIIFLLIRFCDDDQYRLCYMRSFISIENDSRVRNMNCTASHMPRGIPHLVISENIHITAAATCK